MKSLTVKAKEAALIENRIIKISLVNSLFAIYVFMGKDKDYILSENYCSCPHFYYRIFRKNLGAEKRVNAGSTKCYHLQALELALEKDKARSIYVDLVTMKEILLEIYSMDKSFILRKLVMR